MKLQAFAGALAAATILATGAQAQVPPTNFEQAAYITCKEAHAMAPEARKTLAVYLAEHVARYRGVVIPDDDRGAQVAYLVRGACTMYPESHLFGVIDRAIVAEMAKLPKRK